MSKWTIAGSASQAKRSKASRQSLSRADAKRNMNKFQASLGATYVGWGTAFRVWAPEARSVEVVLERERNSETESHALAKSPSGYFAATIPGIEPGCQYGFRVDGQGPYPDPASRFQPRGVHGRSQVVDPDAFAWTDDAWKGRGLEDTILYELHIGTFTPAGTFQSARKKLPLLRDLGVTAIELMPVADFAGSRNWGYDGVAPFAPARCYGMPDDLRILIDDAHSLGLAVHMDVVYNHLGPDGAYQGAFSPHYFSATHQGPWGASINFDGPNSEPVRDYFIENALRWVYEYHVDGLRLDATHAIVDDSVRHVIAAIAKALHLRKDEIGREVLVIAEDSRNLAYMMRPENEGGWGLDGVWADDFHHQMRRALAGDSDGYFRDFDGSVQSIVRTAREGWYFKGQFSSYSGRPRGEDPSGIPLQRFVLCLQNHDQVGNRAMGDRLHDAISLAAYRAASVLLLSLPETPLLFMGQEWAASTPFQYFTDHNPELGRLVREGRREEFRHFQAFSDPESRDSIPDPQDIRTFIASRLDWEEREREPHSLVLRLYKDLLNLRRTIPGDAKFSITALGQHGLLLEREFLVVISLREGDLIAPEFSRNLKSNIILSTEDPNYTADPRPIQFMDNRIHFERPGAVICRAVEVSTSIGDAA